MTVFNTEYVPELKWTLVEPNSYKTDIDKRRKKSIYKSQNYIPDYHRHNNISDIRSILNIIKLIEKMIKYNDIYYERIEKRRQQQDLELQGLTMFLQNIYNDLKNI